MDFVSGELEGWLSQQLLLARASTDARLDEMPGAETLGSKDARGLWSSSIFPNHISSI